MQSPTLFLSIAPRKLCMYTCACTYMCVYQGSCFHMCPRAALQLFLDAACAGLLAGPACSRPFHPVEGREKREGGEGQSYTYIFVLPTDFSCCVLSSVRVTPYMGSGPEHAPPSITTDKLTSQLGSRPMGAFTALLAHAHGNKHTSTRTQKCTRTHALSKCFPLSGPSFLVMEPSPNMGDRSLCLAR